MRKNKTKGWLDEFEMPEAQNGIEGTMGGLTNIPFRHNGAWGGAWENGGSLPGSVGFTYARTGSTPSEGPYAKKTMPSAQDGETLMSDKVVGNLYRPLKNIDLRPIYPKGYYTNVDIVDPNCPDPTGVGCSYQATREAQKITGLPLESYAPADAGYRDAVAERYGLTNIFDQEGEQKRLANSHRSDWKYPTDNDFKNWKAGDIVVLDSGADSNELLFPYNAPPGFTSKDLTKSTHNGVVVGFTPEGRPIIRHGYSAKEKGKGKQITEVLGVDNRVSDLGHGRYAIKSVWRPKEVDFDNTINAVKPIVEKGTERADRKAKTTSNQSFYLNQTDEEKLQSSYPVMADFSGASQRLALKNKLVNLFNDKNLDKELQYKLGITAAELNDLKPVVYGIFGQESNFNDIDSFGRTAKEEFTDFFGMGSRGPAQIKFDSLTDEERNVLGIKSAKDLDSPENSYKAALLLMKNAKNRMNKEIEKGTHPYLTDKDENFRSAYFYNSPHRAMNTAKDWARGSEPVTKNPLTWLNPLYTRERPGVFASIDPDYKNNAELRLDPGSYPYKLMEKAKDLGVQVDETSPVDLEEIVIRRGVPGKSNFVEKRKNGGMSFYQHGLDWTPRNISRDGSIIKDDRGQWAHPGEITEIGSNQITMQGVPYPVLGISDEGDAKMMFPGEDYKFKGKKVTEIPMAQSGKNIADNTRIKPFIDLTKVSFPKEEVRSVEFSEPGDTRSIWSDYRAKERGDVFWNMSKKATTLGQYFPHPMVRYPSIALNSLMGAVDATDSYNKGDLTNAKINAVGAIPLPGYGSIKALRSTPGLNKRQKASIVRSAGAALGLDLFGTSADLTDNFGLEKKQNGGQLPPIYTSNPNDPRLRAYQDSLTLYNLSNELLNNFKKVDGTNAPANVDYVNNLSNKIMGISKKYKNNNEGFVYKNRFKPEKEYPVNITGEGDTNFFTLGKEGLNYGNYPIYKKPVQPVIYQEKPSLKELPFIPAEKIPFSVLPEQSGIQNYRSTIPKEDWQYRVEYEENGKPAHRMFPSQKMGEDFQKLVPGNRSGYWEKIPKVQFGCVGENCRGKSWRPTLSDKSGGGSGDMSSVGGAPVTAKELEQSGYESMDKKKVKQYVKDLQSDFPGLTADDVARAAGDSARIRAKLHNFAKQDELIGKYNEALKQGQGINEAHKYFPYSDYFYGYYRPMIMTNPVTGQPIPPTVPQILSAHASPEEYKQTVGRNYKKKKNGGWLDEL